MKPNVVEFVVYGRQALFSDPINRMGGEKMTYQVPTYEALKGILSSIYWKPTFTWVIDEVRILNPIRSQSKGIRPINYGGGNTLSIYTYLSDVAYQVRAHFEWNEQRPELKGDRNENKHHNIAKRCIKQGGRRDVFLGTRECYAYIEPCVFGEGEGAYDTYGDMPMGVMFHGFTYPDENKDHKMYARFWQPVMKSGVITFTRPEDCTIQRELLSFEPKQFSVDNQTMADVDRFDWQAEFGGEAIELDS
ncbi:MAG: type I-C CRISPR-associated protein Cas5c [Cellulosilyticaceae bacterium]